MPWVSESLVLTQVGFKHVRDLQPDDYVQDPMGTLHRIHVHTIPYTGEVYQVRTEYHSEPLRCTGDQRIMAWNGSHQAYITVQQLTTQHWVGIRCPYHTSHPLPSVEEPFPTYTDALVVQFIYFSHRRALLILETYDHKYLCVEQQQEQQEQQDLWMDHEYIWFRVIWTRPLFQQENLYRIEVEGHSSYVVQGIIV